MRTIGGKYLNPLRFLDFHVRFSDILRTYDVAPIPFRYLRVWEPMALFVDVDVVQEQQERQFHRQHISFDTHSPNLLPEIEIKALEAFRASERVRILLRLPNDSEAEKGALWS